MKRLLLTLLTPCAAAPGFATVHTVMVGQPINQFSPQTVTIDLGDTVRFIWSSGSHTVVADNGEWPSFPMNSAGSHDIILTAHGTVHYHCSLHGGHQSGMWGSITVNDTASAVPDLTARAEFDVTQDFHSGLVSVSSAFDGDLRLMTLDGKIVDVRTISDGAPVILNVGSLPESLYLIVLTSRQGVMATRRIAVL